MLNIFKKRQIREATSYYEELKNEKVVTLDNPLETFQALVRLQKEIHERRRKQWQKK